MGGPAPHTWALSRPSSHNALRGSPLQTLETPTIRCDGPSLLLNTCDSAITKSKCPFKVPITKEGVPLVEHSPVRSGLCLAPGRPGLLPVT